MVGVRPAVVLLVMALAVASAFGSAAISAALLLLVVALVAEAFRHELRGSDLPKDALLFLPVLGWKAATRAVTTSPAEAFRLHDAWYRAPYVAVAAVRPRAAEVRRILHALFASHAAVALWALGQRSFGLPSFAEPLVDVESQRFQGFAGHPNSYAGSIAVVLMVDLAVGLLADRRLLLYMPALGLGSVFAGSRGWWIGVAAAFALLLVSTRSARLTARALGVAILAVLVTVAIVPGLASRIDAGLDPDQNQYRIHFWEISWQVFTEHPVIGVGGGMLPAYLGPHVERGEIDNAAQGHSLYLHELAEGGVPGLVLVVGLLAWFLVKHLRAGWRSPSPLARSLHVGAAMVIVALLVEGVFDHNFSNAVVSAHVSLVLGLAQGHQRRDDDEAATITAGLEAAQGGPTDRP